MDMAAITKRRLRHRRHLDMAAITKRRSRHTRHLDTYIGDHQIRNLNTHIWGHIWPGRDPP